MIAELIASRRAVFPQQYAQKPIDKKTILSLLEAGNWAPTHRRTEPWRFKVFHSDEAKKQLSVFLSETYPKTVEKFSETKMRKLAEKPLQSACVIAICFQRDAQESVPEWEEIASTAMAVQNMWLLATELGLGSYWSTPSLIRYFGEYFPLEEGERCLGFFYLGHYEGESMEGFRNTSIHEKTTWV